jgi:type I restriction enzyme S subunit
MTEKVEFYKETEFKDTEIGRIPKEWEVKKLDEIADPQRGLSYSGEEKSNTETADGYLFLTLNSIKEGGGLKEDGWTWIKSDRIKERHFVREGDIVIANTEQSKDGSLIGSPAIVHFPEWYKKDRAVYSMDLSKLNFKTKILDVQFIFFYLSFVQSIAKVYHTGTNVWHLKVDSWAKDLDVIIPPLSEQQQIASILSTIDEAIQKTNEVIAKTERLKRGMMRELLTKGIGHKEFKDTEIGRIPKEWEVKKLDEIADPQRGLSYSGEEKSNTETADGYLFLTLNSIKEGGGLKEDGWTWIKSDRIKERHFVREGDIVIANTEQSKDGSLIGSPAIVHFPEWYKKDRAVYSMDLSKLNFKTKILDVQFIFFYLSFVQSIAKVYHTGTNVWHLKVDSWAKDLDVIIPPLSEQQQIASILLAIDERLDVLRKERVKLERIKSGFMSDLLSGRIRVGPK